MKFKILVGALLVAYFWEQAKKEKKTNQVKHES